MTDPLVIICLGATAIIVIAGYCIHKAFQYCAYAAITVPSPRWWCNEMDQATMRRMAKKQCRVDRMGE